MCRWLAYAGAPVLIRDALYTPAHSLIDQSLHSRLGEETTNGDGFGIGWYDAEPEPGVFQSVEPAWNDQNLRELACHVRSPLFFAHIRAAIGSSVQQTNCHPFRHERWLWMHNGFIAGFAKIKRELVLAIDPSPYPEIKGQTDTEVLFYLALTLGLEDDPPGAVGRAIGMVEACGEREGIPNPFQGTIATSGGEVLWTFRYSSEGKSRSLFHSRDPHAATAVSRPEDPARSIRRRPAGRLRADRRSPRRMERGAGGDLRRAWQRPGSAAPVQGHAAADRNRSPGIKRTCRRPGRARRRRRATRPNARIADM